jgi:hypothetical protein
MRELLRKACVEARRGNNNIKQQVRFIGNTFLNNVEVSAPEAVYLLLQFENVFEMLIRSSYVQECKSIR